MGLLGLTEKPELSHDDGPLSRDCPDEDHAACDCGWTGPWAETVEIPDGDWESGYYTSYECPHADREVDEDGEPISHELSGAPSPESWAQYDLDSHYTGC